MYVSRHWKREAASDYLLLKFSQASSPFVVVKGYVCVVLSKNEMKIAVNGECIYFPCDSTFSQHSKSLDATYCSCPYRSIDMSLGLEHISKCVCVACTRTTAMTCRTSLAISKLANLTRTLSVARQVKSQHIKVLFESLR